VCSAIIVRSFAAVVKGEVKKFRKEEFLKRNFVA
jgi:hypothetical protein